MRQNQKLSASLLVILFAALPVILRAADSTHVKTRALQLSLITPLGSNGLDSWNVTNRFSINMLAGYAGGISGVEFSGLGSVLRGDMTGAQFAGLGSIVLGATRGVQFSGLYNVGTGSVKAAQFAGLANSATHNARGLQVAGLVNVAAGRMTGTQLSGLVNVAGKLKGVQLGVFNYVDSLERGVPIGFLSIVKNGYTAFEAGATETLYGVVSVKTGVKQFYNIFSAGGGTRNGVSLFAWGYGLGAFIPLNLRTGIAIDGTCYQVNEGEWYTDRLNLLNRVNVTVSFKLAKHLSLFGGVSWNVTVADITDEYGDLTVSHVAPYDVFNETYDGRINVKMYPGLSAGIRL